MTRSPLLAATFAIGLGLSGAANAAAVYLIDDFNHAAGDPFVTTLNKANGVLPPAYTQGPVGYSIGGHAITRSMSFSLITDGSTASSQIAKLTVGPTQLKIENGSLVNSSLSLVYGIGSLAPQIMAAGTGNSSTKFTVNFSDGTGNAGFGIGPTTIQAYLDNVSLGSVALEQVYDQNTAPGQVSFTLLNGLVDGTDSLRFSFSGPTGYDLAISAIALSVNTPMAGDVPEPAMLGLFGFGLMGLGIARRRKR